jgi:hypothetical protein
MNKYDELTTCELDALCCTTARRVDELETFHTDHNGDWRNAKSKREHVRLAKQLKQMDKELEARDDV